MQVVLSCFKFLLLLTLGTRFVTINTAIDRNLLQRMVGKYGNFVSRDLSVGALGSFYCSPGL